jgi:SAM-dependent methyltransferase
MKMHLKVWNSGVNFLKKLIRSFIAPADIASEQWLRVVMDQETKRLVSSIKPASLMVLEISGRGWDQPGIFREYRSVDFPDFDICSQQLDESIDLIIAEQVFEHLLWPYRAARNVHAMLRPGGFFLITTPFLVRVHRHPTDCSRWSEIGMQHFLAECGFDLDDIHTGSWGNRACVLKPILINGKFTNLGDIRSTTSRIFQRWYGPWRRK